MSVLFKRLYYLHFCWELSSLVWVANSPCVDICVPSNCFCFKVACCSAFCFPYGSQRTPLGLCHVSVKCGRGSHTAEGFSALLPAVGAPSESPLTFPSSVFLVACSTPAALAGNISASHQTLGSSQLSEESVYNAVTLDPRLKEALLSSA